MILRKKVAVRKLRRKQRRVAKHLKRKTKARKKY